MKLKNHFQLLIICSIAWAVYDCLYCGIYLNHEAEFVYDYWYLTVYYVLPWILFHPTGWYIERKDRWLLITI